LVCFFCDPVAYTKKTHNIEKKTKQTEKKTKQTEKKQSKQKKMMKMINKIAGGKQETTATNDDLDLDGINTTVAATAVPDKQDASKVETKESEPRSTVGSKAPKNFQKGEKRYPQPLKGNKRHKILKDNIQGVTAPAIRRLCRRGGVKRISGFVYEDVRKLAKSFIDKIMRDTITMTEHSRRKTVTAMDVVHSLKRNGQTLYGFGYSN
jgi:histone H4